MIEYRVSITVICGLSICVEAIDNNRLIGSAFLNMRSGTLSGVKSYKVGAGPLVISYLLERAKEMGLTLIHIRCRPKHLDYYSGLGTVIECKEDIVKNQLTNWCPSLWHELKIKLVS